MNIGLVRSPSNPHPLNYCSRSNEAVEAESQARSTSLAKALEWGACPTTVESAFTLKGAQLGEAIFHPSKKRKTVENRSCAMHGWMAVHVGQRSMDAKHLSSVYSLPDMRPESELSHLKGHYIGPSPLEQHWDHAFCATSIAV